MDNNWKEYLAFTQKERIGIYMLLLVIVLSIASPWYFKRIHKPGVATLEEFEQKARMLQAALADTGSDNNRHWTGYIEPAGQSHYALFEFDPNTLDAAGWKKLGLTAKTTQTIQKYIAGGGRFYKAEDLEKIYGLRKEEFKRLQPYIRIVNTKSAPKQWPEERNKAYKKEIIPVEINTADTAAFIALPGIGSKLANRLISFRNKLGGFYSVEQMAEVYGLPDSTFQQIKQWLQCTTPVNRKININTATVDSLKQHPYIKWNIANALIQYRQQHGPYRSVEEIQQIMLVTPEIYRKIVLYLAVE